MQDRIPVNPGRVLIAPENGSAAYYATMTRADNPTQEGTPLNKANLLRDETAAKFGLGADAVPNDVFNALAFKNISNLCIEKIQISKNWTAPKATNQIFKVFAVGGGGSGSKFAGGGSGYVEIANFEIAEGTVVPVVCGAGGIYSETGSDGGATSFGNLLTAAGGKCGNADTGNGGDGGAGGGGCSSNTTDRTSNGGNGGKFGGGGGGGYGSICSGGNGGEYGGGGGRGYGGSGGGGGNGGIYGGNGGAAKAPGNDAPSDRPGLRFLEILTDQTSVNGNGLGGSAGNSGGGGGSYYGNGGNGRDSSRSGGGGGGGYCGNGGNGSGASTGGAGGGGGGGYCGNGGNGGSYGGGGGGGFFCNGGNGNTSSNYIGGGGGGFFSDGIAGSESDANGRGNGGNGGVLIMYFKEETA